jgi:hypothetical protein
MKTNDKSVKAVALAAFPEYKGRKFFFEVQKYPLDARSYWDEGSRDYFRFVRLSDNHSVEVPVQSAYDPKISGLDAVILPEGFVCVRRSIFRGKESGLTVIVNPANVAAVLEKNVDPTTEFIRGVQS